MRNVWPMSPPSQPENGQSLMILGFTTTSMYTSKSGMISLALGRYQAEAQCAINRSPSPLLEHYHLVLWVNHAMCTWGTVCRIYLILTSKNTQCQSTLTFVRPGRWYCKTCPPIPDWRWSG